MRNLVFLTVFFLSFVASANQQAAPAKTAEYWECWVPYKGGSKPHVAAYVHEGQKTGEIHTANVIYRADYLVEGLDRRWSFGSGVIPNGFSYTFVIMPGGAGLYYDFVATKGKTALPSTVMNCYEKEIKNPDPNQAGNQ